MLHALALATLSFMVPGVASGQPLSVLHIKVALVDAERHVTPVPRHALLISDNPATAAPRRIVTALDGTADVRLRPGSYTVESDKPVAFEGKSYEWTQMVDIVTGRDAVLELTANNAEVGPITSETTPFAAPLETDPSVLLQPWQDSVVALWTSTSRASGLVVDTKGLIATSQRAVGTATSVEVQLTPTVKVAGRVLVADPARDVAVLWIDPKALASVRPVPLGCALPARQPLVAGQKIFTIGSPLRERKGVTSGAVSRVEPHAVVSDFDLADGSAGGPVFAADGVVVGITSGVNEKNERRREQFRVVRIDDVCDVVASAEKKMTGATQPNGTHLPVEPARPFPVDALTDAAQRRAASLSPYVTSSPNFDIAFITPVLTYSAQQQLEQTNTRERREGARMPDAQQASVRGLLDFDNWSAYVADVPPVLLVRATPKLVEGFWTTVARGAALTQGIAVPAIKHFKSGFSRMRAFCGEDEVTPIHPFRLEHRISESEVLDEGLYVFDPGALGPQCGTVKLVLYSEKAPERGEARVIDPKVIRQVWQDFAPYRALN